MFFKKKHYSKTLRFILKAPSKMVVDFSGPDIAIIERLFFYAMPIIVTFYFLYFIYFKSVRSNTNNARCVLSIFVPRQDNDRSVRPLEENGIYYPRIYGACQEELGPHNGS